MYFRSHPFFKYMLDYNHHLVKRYVYTLFCQTLEECVGSKVHLFQILDEVCFRSHPFFIGLQSPFANTLCTLFRETLEKCMGSKVHLIRIPLIKCVIIMCLEQFSQRRTSPQSCIPYSYIIGLHFNQQFIVCYTICNISITQPYL